MTSVIEQINLSLGCPFEVNLILYIQARAASHQTKAYHLVTSEDS